MIAGLLLAGAGACAMEPLDAEEMADVTGQEGIRLGLEMRLNTDATGAPITTGTGFTNCANPSNLSSTGCRLALQFANRADEWVVLKNFSGYMSAPAVFLDSGRTPVAATSYEDLDRFRDENGTPLLTSPNDLSVIQIRFMEPIEYGLTIGGIGVEYGPTGYLNNAELSALGLKIGDVNGGPATINAEGVLSIYGF